MSVGAGNEGWIAWFARNPVAANLLMMILLLGGFWTFAGMRAEGFPESAPDTVVIDVAFDGGSPETIEEGAVIKIEEALSGVPGLKKMTADINADAAKISVRGQPGYPVRDLRAEIKTRVDAIQTFPEQVETITISEAVEESEIVTVQVSGDVDHRALKLAAKRVRKRLLALPSVNKVDMSGARTDQIDIAIEEAGLRDYGLSFEDVAAAVQRQSANMSAGELLTGAGSITLQSREQAYFARDFEDIVVRAAGDGGAVRVRDVAAVTDGFDDTPVFSTFQGASSIKLDVRLIGRESVLDASAAVHGEIARIRDEGWLPAGVSLATWVDEAEAIRDNLQLLSRNALLGMVFVLVLLALFLDLKIAFWVAVGIPVSFAGAFLVMGPGFLDYSINDLTIFAFILVLGIVVDDAIIIAESIHAYRRRHGASVESAIKGAKAVATPATFGVLTTVAAFYPLTTIQGDFGGPFKIIAVVTIACLLFSLVESKLILPAHLAGQTKDDCQAVRRRRLFLFWWRIRQRIDVGVDAVTDRIYRPLLTLAVRRRYQAMCVSLAILILSIGLVSGGLVPVVFFGEENDRVAFARVEMAVGATAGETHGIAERIQRQALTTGAQLELRYGMSAPAVLNAAVTSASERVAEVAIELATGSNRPFLSQEFLDLWRSNVGEIADVETLNFYVDFEDDADLRIEVSSTDVTVLPDAMRRLAAETARFAGVSDIHTDLDNDALEFAIALKPEASRLGLGAHDVALQVRHAVFGYESQRVQRDDEEVRVKVRYPARERDSVGGLDRLRIRTPDGAAVPLPQVADISPRRSPSKIVRIDGRRVMALTARIEDDLAGRSDVIRAINADVFPKLRAAFPSATFELTGDSEQEEEASAQLGSGFVVGLLIVFALLAVPLRSYVDPLAIMLAIPFGVVGAIFGHLIIGMPLSLLSFFGILALAGVMVNDALVLFSRYNDLRREGRAGVSAIVEAGTSRFRAVFLTSVTTFVGLFPLIAETSEQAQNLKPMAVSLAFGILFGSVVTLIITPVLIGVREDIRALAARRPDARTTSNHGAAA